MSDQPDFIFPTAEIGGIEVAHYPVVLRGSGCDVLRLHYDMSAELGDGVTIREAIAHLASAACGGIPLNHLCWALADEIIRMAREDRDE